MNARIALLILLTIAVAAPGLHALAAAVAPQEVVHKQFQAAIPNLPGKSLTSVVVEYAPGASSSAHRHAPSAFVYVYVLSGAIRSQVDDEPPRVYRAGEDFYESPGAHHRVSENASATQPARLLAVFVGERGQTLTIPDRF